MEFAKDLSASEAKYKYVGLPKKIREAFPPKDELFDVKFKGKIYKMKVNNKDCIMLTQLYSIHRFEEGEGIRFTHVKKFFELELELQNDLSKK